MTIDVGETVIVGGVTVRMAVPTFPDASVAVTVVAPYPGVEKVAPAVETVAENVPSPAVVIVAGVVVKPVTVICPAPLPVIEIVIVLLAANPVPDTVKLPSASIAVGETVTVGPTVNTA